MPVSAQAVLKAGGAFVLLDPSMPPACLQALCIRLETTVIVMSAEKRAIAETWYQIPCQ
ncbi:hypothetical protein EYZ11_010636 [Aspergillus tanneri]|nr:hypothetical protein EYZ11_010636 [Aspergillus tanneri]